jgi:hypothetical protein
MATLRSLVLALVCACTTEQSVLAISEVTSCQTAFEATAGTACAFSGTCQQNDPNNATCCTNTAYCNDGSLVRNTQCNPDCTPCNDDTGCQPGSAICLGDLCTPCPSTAGCGACPQGWARLHRNGCETCDCAPVPECINNGTPTCNNDPNLACYAGERCAAGCAPSDPDCCTNECAAPGCNTPSPVGCLMQCSPNMQPQCNQCAAESCACTNGAFVCTPRCIDGFDIQASCIAN